MSDSTRINGVNSFFGYKGNIDMEHFTKNEEINIFPSEKPEGTNPKIEITSELLEKIKEKLDGEDETLQTRKDADFTAEEADIYAKGEAEIDRMVQQEILQNATKATILGAKVDIEKIEQECREKYAKEHPEYKEVMEEGLAVENAHDKVMEQEKEDWIKDNPQPPMFNTKKPIGTGDFQISEEYKQWQAEMERHMEYVEKKYVEDNPDYANLKDAKKGNEQIPIWKASL